MLVVERPSSYWDLRPGVGASQGNLEEPHRAPLPQQSEAAPGRLVLASGQLRMSEETLSRLLELIPKERNQVTLSKDGSFWRWVTSWAKLFRSSPTWNGSRYSHGSRYSRTSQATADRRKLDATGESRVPHSKGRRLAQSPLRVRRRRSWWRWLASPWPFSHETRLLQLPFVKCKELRRRVSRNTGLHARPWCGPQTRQTSGLEAGLCKGENTTGADTAGLSGLGVPGHSAGCVPVQGERLTRWGSTLLSTYPFPIEMNHL